LKKIIRLLQRTNTDSERNGLAMKKRLLIIGASGHGKVVADIAIKMNKWRTVSFLDDNESIKSCMGMEVIGKSSDALIYRDEADFFVAIGDNATRKMIQEDLESQGCSFVNLIHPSAIIGSDVEIGVGTAVMAGVVINGPCRIGKGCIINTNSTLEHDNVIDDYVHISPGVTLAGTVSVGQGSWLGVGSIVSNDVSICPECKIGAGTVVIKDITEPGTYIGVPARKIY